MSGHWNPNIYNQFIDMRTRPAQDLLAAIPKDFFPQTIYDLGCGPGNSTIILKERWPQATVVGIDSSAEMLKTATQTFPDIKFIKADIAEFIPNEKIDCLFANASLQWLDQHDTLLPKLLNFLPINGILAIQMPNNWHNPSHQTVFDILNAHADWRPLLKNLRYGKLQQPFYHLTTYYNLFVEQNVANIQLWETEYFHALENYQKIFEWIKGTGLREVLNNMSQVDQDLFAKLYVEQIANQYPQQADNKILLPFRRIFMIVKK